jgi:putative tricarboxylic transport membrane protein
MRRVNRIVAACLIGAIFPLWETAGRFPGTAAIFPRVSLVVLGILALILLVSTFWQATSPAEHGEGERGIAAAGKPLALFAITAVAAVAMSYVGFFPAMAVMAGALFWVLGGERPWFYLAAVTVLFTMIYLVFVRALHVPLTTASLFD